MQSTSDLQFAPSASGGTTSTPLDGIDVVLSDLDGVVYAGDRPLPHAIQSLAAVANTRRVGFITNNASRTDASVAEQLNGLGLRVRPSDIVTSPQAAVRILRALVPEGSLVLVVGGEGLVSVLLDAGFRVTGNASDGPAAVIQGFAPDVGWKQLAEASFALATPEAIGGIPWVATNGDLTLPVSGGVAPGNGSLVNVVRVVVGREPVVAGKPEPAIFREAVARFGALRPLFIGDRLDTDVVGARRAGISSALVLTGISGPAELFGAGPDERPDYVLADLRDLHSPYPPVLEEARNVVAVGQAAVRLDGTRLQIVRDGACWIDLVRAVAHAVWRSGRNAAELDIPSSLDRQATSLH